MLTTDAVRLPAERRARLASSPVSSLVSGRALVAYVAAVKFLLHMATARTYGFFIDELYFLAAGQHLAWGYVDFPPLTAFQAFLTRALFGDSAFSIRLFPSLAGAGLVLLTGALVRALGGGRFAQLLAALAVLAAPAYLAFDSYLSMNSIEPLLWTGCALLLVRMIQMRRPSYWISIGLLSGVGMLNKHTMLLFGFALVAGLALTPERGLLWNRWTLMGGAVAFLMFLPNLAWMYAHGFPHLELLANIRRNQRNVEFSPSGFVKLQILFANPVALPLWLAGLWHLVVSREARAYRALGWACVGTFGVLLGLSARPYYVVPIYGILFAAGAVALERALAAPRVRWLRTIYATLVILAGALIAPTAMPLLAPDAYGRYTKAIGIEQPTIENRRTSSMPQLFADRFGWPEMAGEVARAWHEIPEPDRGRTAIFANDYGQGGAIDFFGPALGLPRAIGGHLGYWYWGPREYTGESVLVLGDDRPRLEGLFEDVRQVGTVGHPLAMAKEHFGLFWCRRPKGWTFQTAWPELKKFD